MQNATPDDTAPGDALSNDAATDDAAAFPMALTELALGFAAARGARLEPCAVDALAAAGGGLFIGAEADGEPSAVIVSTAPDRTPVDAVLEALATAKTAGVARRIPVICATRKGVGPQQLSAIAAAGGAPLSPLQFADWPFRAAQDDDDAGPISARLRDAITRAEIPARAAQPFRRLTAADLERGAAASGAAPKVDGPDLVTALAASMAAFPDRPVLRVVAGPAGVGKTVMIGALLRRLHDGFNAAKRRGGAASRPLLFEPAELGATAPDTVDALIETLYASRLARHLPPDAFRWLHEAGVATWVFDGLDEFFRAQTDFFARIGESLDAPGGRAQTVICTRDSLFASSDALRGFLQDRLARAPESVEIYELTRWDAAAKRRFVELALARDEDAGADPGAVSALAPRVDAVMAAMDADGALGPLTDLPFYCDLFVQAHRRGEVDGLKSEFELLQWAIDAIIAREARKLSIGWEVFVSESETEDVAAMAKRAAARGLGDGGENPFADALKAYGQDNLEFLIGAASHFYRFGADDARALAQVSIEEWREAFSPAYLDAALDEETEERVRLALLQFAFFSRGEGGDSIAFTHDILADFLAAKYAAALIRDNPDRPAAWKQARGQRQDIGGTVFERYLVAQLRAEPELGAGIRPKLSDPVLTPADRSRIEALLKAADTDEFRVGPLR